MFSLPKTEKNMFLKRKELFSNYQKNHSGMLKVFQIISEYKGENIGSLKVFVIHFQSIYFLTPSIIINVININKIYCFLIQI